MGGGSPGARVERRCNLHSRLSPVEVYWEAHRVQALPSAGAEGRNDVGGGGVGELSPHACSELRGEVCGCRGSEVKLILEVDSPKESQRLLQCKSRTAMRGRDCKNEVESSLSPRPTLLDSASMLTGTTASVPMLAGFTKCGRGLRHGLSP